MIYLRSKRLARISGVGWLLLAWIWFTGHPARLNADTRAVDPAQSQKRIQMLPEAERQRLARNLKTFEGLSAEERAKYQKLKADLDEDRRLGGGLEEVLDQYCKWLNSLSVEDRDKLRNQKNYSLRTEMVKHLIDNQPKKAPDEATKVDAGAGHDQPLVAQDPVSEEIDFGPDDPYLSAEDLAAVMAVFEKTLLTTTLLKDQERARLQTKQGVEHYLYLLSFLSRREQGKKERWLTEPAFREMVKVISNAEQQRKIQADETPAEKTKDFFFLIRRGIHKELEAEIEQDSGRRTMLFNKLTYEDQQRIKDVPREQQAGLIAETFMKQLLRAAPQFNEELRKQWANQKKADRERAKASGLDPKD